MRFDAVPHFSERFLREFIAHLDKECGENWFFVGEFWRSSKKIMTDYLSKMNHKFSLFDVPLVYNFSRMSTDENADLRQVFDETLCKDQPTNAVTLVMNHDTQPGQTCAVKMETYFKTLAYCFILLRISGFPCVFYGVSFLQDIYTT